MSEKTNELTLEEEKIIFSTWISGNHREDIKLFNAGIFSRPAVFNAIKEGKTVDDLKSQGLISYKEMAELMDNNGLFYLTARKKGLEVRLKGLIEKCLSLDDTQEKTATLEQIERIKCVIGEREYLPKAKNYVQIFEDEINARQTETPAFYGLKDLDQVSGGIHRGQLIVIGARTGVGKSAISLQIADNVQQAGNKVLYFPLEMTTFETFERLLLRHELITSEETRRGNISESKKAGINAYLGELERRDKFVIYEGLNSLDAIEQKIKSEQPYLVVIDQLTQVTPSEKAKDVRERYIQVTRKLKEIALHEKVAILLLSQLNREAEKTQTLTAAHLHESDSIGQDADVILMLTRDEDEPQGQRLQRMTLTLVKQRQGRNGVKIPLAFYGDKCDFKDSFTDKNATTVFARKKYEKPL